MFDSLHEWTFRRVSICVLTRSLWRCLFLFVCDVTAPPHQRQEFNSRHVSVYFCTSFSVFITVIKSQNFSHIATNGGTDATDINYVKNINNVLNF